MKKWLLPLLLLLTSQLKAETYPLTDFHGGLNSHDSSLTIADNEVKESLNVLFDENNSVIRRTGLSTVTSTSAIKFTGGWNFTDTSANNWRIYLSTFAIHATNGSGSFSVKIATVTSGDIVNAVTAFNKIWFVDRTQGVYSWDGSVTSFISGSPKGKYIAQYKNRIAVIGLVSPNQSYLYLSKYLDGTTWTTGSLSTDPVILPVGLGDAADIPTALYSGFNDVLLIFKRNQIWALFGTDQTDFQLRSLNTEVGCIDQRTIQPFHDGLVFVSARAVEFYNGSKIYPISDKIKDYIDLILSATFNYNTITQTSKNDFDAGFTSYTYTDTIPGSVSLEKDISTTSTSSWTTLSGNFGVSGSDYIQALSGITQSAIVYTSNIPVGGTYYAEADISATNTCNISTFAIVNTSTAGYFISWTPDFSPGCIGTTPRIQAGKFNGTTFTVSTSSTGIYCNISNANLIIGMHGNTKTIYVNDILVASFVDSTYVNPSRPYFITQDYCGNSSDLGSIGNAKVISSTGTFYSSVVNTPSMSSWDLFNATKQSNDGSHTFYIRSSTNSFAVSSTTPAWVAQTVNTIVSTSTGTYFQMRDDFALSIDTGSIPLLNDFSFNWYSGSILPPMASATFKQRYYLSISTTVDLGYNNAVFVLGKNFEKAGPVWTLFDWQVGGFVVQNDKMYHGSSSALGKEYRDFVGYNDSGVAINSYIKTKDYNLGDITLDKIFNSLYLYAENLGPYSISTSYAVNKSDTYYSLDDVEQDESDGILNVKLPFPISSNNTNFGKTISFKFQNNSLDEQMSVIGGLLIYTPRKLIQ